MNYVISKFSAIHFLPKVNDGVLIKKFLVAPPWTFFEVDNDQHVAELAGQLPLTFDKVDNNQRTILFPSPRH